MARFPTMVIVPGKVDDDVPDALSRGAFAQVFKEAFEMVHEPVECKMPLAPTLEPWKEIDGNPRTQSKTNSTSANETK